MSDAEDILNIERCLQGEPAAYELIVEKYQKPIFNIAFRMVRRYEDAQDITQTVFLKAYRNLSSFKTNYRFFSWIYRMAVNESINHLSQVKMQAPLEADHISTDPTPEQVHVKNETKRQIDEAISTLTPENRAVIVLRHFQDMSYDEIADTLKIPEKTVKSRLYEARRLLLGALAEKGVEVHD